MQKPTIIGITGGIGGGKTTFSTRLRECNQLVFDTDTEAKKLQNEDKEVIKELKQLFGDEIYQNGILDRKHVAQIVFSDKKYLSKLNEIIHPRVRAKFNEWVKENSNRKFLFMESAILFERGLDAYVDSTLVVTAPENVRVQRVMKRDNQTEEQVKARISHQMNEEEKIKRATWTINTHGIKNTREKVDIFLNMLENNEKMKSYDVVIVGAGPAGLRCAEVLANSSLKVLILEKNKEIGPKVCAGGLTGKGMEYLNLPDEMIEFKFNSIKLNVNHIPSTIKSSRFFAYTIDRKEFGQWQLSKISNVKNIEIRTEARVTEITPEYISVNDEKIKYKTLVGADGSNSSVRRYLGLKTEKVVAAIQYIIPTDKFKDFELYFQPRKFHAGYVWIFPHKNYASIGAGCDGKTFPTSKLKKNFHQWLKNHRIDISNATYEAFPINADYQGYKFGNVYLLGDAAGLASGFTGEGIYQALVSGEEVAKQILNPDYEPDLSRVLRNLKYHDHLYALSNKWGRSRAFLYFAGMFLLKYSKKWRRKFIDVVG